MQWIELIFWAAVVLVFAVPLALPVLAAVIVALQWVGRLLVALLGPIGKLLEGGG